LISGVIEDWQITASSTYPSTWDAGCHQKYARVYQPNGVAWCAKHKSVSEWLQVDLGIPAKVTGLMTQGRADGVEWVTSYMVSYSLDAYHWIYVTDYYNNRRVFDGNSDSYQVKHAYLDEPIIARYIKFHTTKWNRHPSLRVEIIGCRVCHSPIALPPYGKVTASSERNSANSSSCQPDDGFIITQKGWSAKHNDANQWLQYDVGPPTLITGVVTRGRGDTGRRQWVTRFLISYSNDTALWYFYKDASHLDIKEFGGNTNRDVERYHYFATPFVARYVRFHPVEWFNRISMRAGLIGCPHEGDCGPGFLRVVKTAPCVENVAYKKDSWINNKRQFKRHIRSQWVRGQASRAVDGDPTVSTQSCTVLDNFNVDRPTWRVDLGRKTRVSGVKIITWQGRHDATAVVDPQHESNIEYMANLDRLTVYVDNSKIGGGGYRHFRRKERRRRARQQRRSSSDLEQDNYYTQQEDDQQQPTDNLIARMANVCGFVSRFNDAIYRSVLHIQCARPLYGRYVYIEASGVASRRTRLFSAALCEVMVYQ
jgi:lactadherin